MSGYHEKTERATTEETLALPSMWAISAMQNVNQRTPEQIKALTKKRELGFRMWQSCIRLAWLQVELGGSFYIEQPQRCMSWRLQDSKTRYLLDQLSSYCIRDQCFDGLVHAKTGLPMQREQGFKQMMQPLPLSSLNAVPAMTMAMPQLKEAR